MRWRGMVKPARPYLCLLVIVVLVLAPPVRPLWCGRMSAAVAARMSGPGPRVRECARGRPAARAGDPPAEVAAAARVRGRQGREGGGKAGQGGHPGAGGGEPGRRLVLAGCAAVRPGEQDRGRPARRLPAGTPAARGSRARGRPPPRSRGRPPPCPGSSPAPRPPRPRPQRPRWPAQTTRKTQSPQNLSHQSRLSAPHQHNPLPPEVRQSR